MKLPFVIGIFTVLCSAALNSSNINILAEHVSRVESIRDIKNVQKQFAHFAQFGRWQAMSRLFSSSSTFIWGSSTVHNPSKIEQWLRADAGNMDGIRPGSLNTLIIENPVISLSPDGTTAKGRWNGLRFEGDGMGGSRIRGGVYENEYIQTDKGWRISLLHYHEMYEGDYKNGPKNVGGRGIPLVPYHFSAESAGVPIPPSNTSASVYTGTIKSLHARIQRLNEEDSVRNLMHAHGFYVDRRMWTDVLDLHTEDTTVQLNQGAIFAGKPGIRKFLERMGPEGLTFGINNDQPIFDMIADVDVDSGVAFARGLQIAMIGDVNTQTASWGFSVFYNRFIKVKDQWMLQDVKMTSTMTADYDKGWGWAPLGNPTVKIPPFLELVRSEKTTSDTGHAEVEIPLHDLERRLRRSEAFDGTENQSNTYGYYADDIQGDNLGALFAQKGHKLSPFGGFFHTPERITGAMTASYGRNRSTLRTSVSYHWRPQPVILVSEDGRSATIRARLLQPSTSITKAGGFNSAIYHDQVVLEDGKWRLWSVTIDEFYWQSSSWAEGWSHARRRNSSEPNTPPSAWTKKYPPDVTLVDVGDREGTFGGGGGRLLQWPEIQRMWFQYRNLVSGRMPEWYWPGCVPCRVREDWSLESNGWQEPPTGPKVRV